MKTQRKSLPSCLGAGILAAFLLPVSGPKLYASNDPPPRVSYIEGTAAYEPAGDVDWSEVVVNLPLLSGDRIFSHAGARVEVEVGKEDFLRLTEETDVSFVKATGDEVELNLNLGSVILRTYDADRYTINTPVAGVRFNKKGLYRVSVDGDGTVRVAVKKGTAEIRNGAGSRKVTSGQELIIEGPQSSLSNVVAYASEDSFDLWSDRRDARQVASTSVVRVGGSYVHGVYDLDYYGYWDEVPGYGHAWFPSVHVGWTPYRYGRWAHYPAWGWTWVGYEPWGWLPYHYGNWFYYSHSSRWCWVPGVSFSFWSPALVNFYFGGGYVGWSPRGPHHNTIVNDNSVTVVNNNTTIVNGWTRRGPGEGLTVVRQEDFGRGTGNSYLQNPDRQLVGNLQSGLPENIRETSWRGRSSAANMSPVRSAGAEVSRNSLRGRSSARESGSSSALVRNDSSASARSRSAAGRVPSSSSVASSRSRTEEGGTPSFQETRRSRARSESTTPAAVAGRDRPSTGSSQENSSVTRGNSSRVERPSYWGGTRGQGNQGGTSGTRPETSVITIPRRDGSRGSTSASPSRSSRLSSSRDSNWFGSSRARSGESPTVRNSGRNSAPAPSSVSASGSRVSQGRSPSFGSSREGRRSGSGVTVVQPRSSGWSGSRSVAPRLSSPRGGSGLSRSTGRSSVPSVRSAPSRRSGSSASPGARRGRP